MILDLSPPMLWPDTKVINVHDGDTITVDVPLGKYIGGRDISLGFHVNIESKHLHYVDNVRLYGLNAPELATPEGKTAQNALDNLINGKFITLTTWLDRSDKYGRILAGVKMLDGTDVNQWLIDNGYAAYWDGHGPKPVPVSPPA